MFNRPYWLVVLAISCAGVVPGAAKAQEAAGQKPAVEGAPKAKDGLKPAKPPAAAELPGPAADNPPSLLPVLPTVPVPHGGPAFNHHMVDASVLPRDRTG